MWLTILALLSKVPGTFLNLFAGINVNGVIGGVGNFFKALFANIKAHWAIWLVGVLIAFNFFSVWEWRSTDTKLVRERAAHAADVNAFKQAQREADTKAQMVRAVLLKESKANAAQADANYTTLASQYHASLLRFGAHQGHSGQSNHNQLSTPEGGNGPSSSTDLPPTITITGSDAEICAINTARLVAVHDWAVSLPKDGESIIK